MKKVLTAVLTLISAASLNAQTFVFGGDSITDGGWGRSGGSAAPTSQRNQTDKNHIYGHSFMMLCASDWQAEYPERETNFFNRGISGDTLEKLAARWDEDVLSLRPDVLTILIGINDATKEDFDSTRWESRFRELLQKTVKAMPSVHLMLCTPFYGVHKRITETVKANVTAEQNTVRRLAEEFGAVLVEFDSLFSKLYEESPRPDDPYYWIWDGVHPTAAGHRKMANLWEKAYETAPAKVVPHKISD